MSGELTVKASRTHHFEPVPIDGIESLGGSRFRVTADRGLFELRGEEKPLPGGWVEIDVRLQNVGGAPPRPRLLVDRGDGLAAGERVPLSSTKRGVSRLSAAPRAFLLEVGHGAEFELHGIRIRRIARAEAAWRLAAPLVWRRLREPRDLPTFAGKFLRRLLEGGWRGVTGHLLQKARGTADVQYDDWREAFDTPSEEDRAAIRSRIADLRNPPRFSILVRAASDGEPLLAGTRRDLQAQLYPGWDLCVARNLNDALGSASGEFVLVLAPGDRLAEHALYLLAEAIDADREADLVYGDEDSISDRDRRYAPRFKPDFNLDLSLAQDYIGRGCALRTSRVREVGGFRPDLDDAEEYDVRLRLLRLCGRDKVRHVPFVLRHSPGNVEGTSREQAEDREAHAVQSYLGDRASVQSGPFPGTRRIRWRLPEKRPMVSMIIPTRDLGDVLRVCLDTILEQTTYRPFEILVVDNQSRDEKTLSYLGDLPSRGAVRVLRYDKPFNYSAIQNFAAREARGEVLALLNNDLEVLHGDWLEELVSHAVRPEVGCVGARLLYPDRTVQHAGVILGISGAADHANRYLGEEEPGYCNRARLQQEWSAVTAACLLVRKSVYDEVSGFDESWAVAFNDVDFCLRVREAGYHNVWTPYATLIHHESKSRGKDDTRKKRARARGEIRRLQARWGRELREDPAYNPNLTLEQYDFGLAWPPRTRRPWER